MKVLLIITLWLLCGLITWISLLIMIKVSISKTGNKELSKDLKTEYEVTKKNLFIILCGGLALLLFIYDLAAQRKDKNGK